MENTGNAEEKDLKASIFNFVYKKDEVSSVLYNTFTKAIIEVDNDEFALLNNISKSFFDQCNENDKKIISAFKENGFIVDEDFDEIEFLRYFHYKTKFSNEQLSFTIAPTLECNFACPYCYESERKGKMSKDVQDKIIEYISKKIDEGVKKLDITWYGGEPLICANTVDYMSAKINNIAEQKNVIVSFSLVTNGYLVTDEIVAMFEKNNILSLQITIDGLADMHNKRRYLKSGAGTFDKILANLNCFKDTKINVNIRMNVDRENYIDFPALKKTIDATQGVKMGVYPSIVENIKERDAESVKHYMNQSDYEQFIMSNYSNDNNCNVDIDIINNRRFFCSAELENSYVIDEKGNFYKCWDEIGIDANICFNVAQMENINYAAIVKYVADDPFADVKCLNCKFLPLCFGGCKFQKNILKKSVCNFSDETMKLFIESKYIKNAI